jgi:hypothetical protein
MSCDHYKRWTEWVEYKDDWTGEMVEELVEREECLYKDVDLHRTRCSNCGHILYYSGAARRFYEEGIPSPGIRGLE